MASLDQLLNGVVIGVHLFSAHSRMGMNNQNPGVFVRTPAGFTAGAYENSVSRTRFAGAGEPRRISTYAGWTFETGSRRFALTVGAATGYGRRRQVICLEQDNTGACTTTQQLNEVNDVVPFAVPSLRMQISGALAARVGYIYTPTIGTGSRPVHAAHVMLEYRR
jgi:hypothetical protein